MERARRPGHAAFGGQRSAHPTLEACDVSRECRARSRWLPVLTAFVLGLHGLAAPDQPWTETAVTFGTPAAQGAGTFLQPLATGQLPCVVIVGGTLSQTRDGELHERGAPPRNALKRLAEALAAAGYASLRYDRVGFGGSQAQPGWTGSYRDEARMAAAAMAWAREQTNVSQVLVAGESAGAYLACLAAEAGTHADAYVFLGGFCGTSHELYDYNFGRLARYAGSSPERFRWAGQHARRDLALGRHFEAMLAAAAAGEAQFELVDGEFRMTLGLARRREELRWPPADMFKHIRAPALALAGKEDLNVPSEHAWRIAQTINAAGNTNVAALLLSACDHSFQWLPPDHDHDVAFRERYTLESFKRGYNTNVYAAMIGWLRKVVPSPADPALAIPPAPTTPPWQRAIAAAELDPTTGHTPERLQLAPGIEIIEDITDRARTAGVETLEGRIGPLLLAEGCQAHFIEMPAGMYAEEHPHGSESLIYTVRGRWVLCSQGRRQVMKPGSLFRFGAHISTGYEVPFDEPASILIFKGGRTTAREEEFIQYLQGMASRLEGQRGKGQEVFRFDDLPAAHAAREFAGQLHASPAAITIGFDQDLPGQVPAGWTSAITGEGTPRWEVVTDATAPSRGQGLRQSAAVPKPSFPLCLKEEVLLRDGFVQAEFKTVSGEIDQAAGVVWRARDAANYYVCRANALENNVVLYKVQDGRRQALDIVGRTGGYGVETKVAPGVWHTLRVEFAGARFRVVLDGNRLFEVEDATFGEAGRVGLWTKADSVTSFDDFRYAGR